MVDRTLAQGLGAVTPNPRLLAARRAALPDIFREEGPGVGGTSIQMRPRIDGGYEFPSVDVYADLLNKGVPEDMMIEYLISGRGQMPNEPISPAGAEEALARVVSMGYEPPKVGTLTQRAQRQAEADRIAAMSPDLDIFALEGPERAGIGAATAFAPEPAQPSQASVAAEKPPAQLTREPAPFDAAKADAEVDPVEGAFTDAMSEYLKASGQDLPEERDLDFYRKQFAEATGLDISGKPDKRAALMAFGLALMQNRAGKGFNIGNILRSVGEAGEAAMPALQEAKKEAKAARMAAGKYAMDQIAADRNARAALAAEQREFAREAYLKQMEIDAEAAKTAGNTEIKNVGTIPVVPGLDIRRGMFNGRGVFIDGSATANTLARGYNTANGALQTLTALENAISEIAESPSPALTIIADRVNSALAGAGLKDPKVSFGEEGLSPEAKATALRESVLAEFKRFLSQETGNGISEGDVQRVLDLLGKIDLFGNPQAAIFRVRETRGLFEGKLQAISPFIEDAINDPAQYVNQSEYDRAMQVFNKRLGESSPYAVTVDEGVPTVDVTGG